MKNTDLLLIGNEFKDSSPNNQELAPYNATIVDINQNNFTKGIKLNAGNFPALDIPRTDIFTIDSWFIINSDRSSEDILVSDKTFEMFIEWSTKKIKVRKLNLTKDNIILQSISTVSKDKPIHVSLTGDSNKIKLYINGVMESESDIMLNTASTPLVIGSGPTGYRPSNITFYNFRQSNIVRYSSNFDVPTMIYGKPYVEILLHDRVQVKFRISIEGDVLSKAEVYLNDIKSNEFTSELNGVLSYIKDKSIQTDGINKLKIVPITEYNNTYFIEVEYQAPGIPPLPEASSYIDILNKVNEISLNRQEERNELALILKEKGVEVSENDLMCELINKIRLI